MSATEAERIGLINRVVPAEQLDITVADWARRLAELSPSALSLTKTMLNQAFTTTMADALEDEARGQALSFADPDFGTMTPG